MHSSTSNEARHLRGCRSSLLTSFSGFKSRWMMFLVVGHRQSLRNRHRIVRRFPRRQRAELPYGYEPSASKRLYVELE